MIVEKNSADFYINKIKNNEFFSFTRWGDGEWACTVGRGGRNCDGHEYFKEMSQDLRLALTGGKKYYKAIWPVTHRQIQINLDWISKFLNENNIEIPWANAIVWEDLVIRQGIEKLVSVLESKDLIIVSDKSKKKLNIEYKDFIEIPPKNCYLEKSRIKNSILQKSKEYKYPVFALSASMATNVIVDELFDQIGSNCWMIDFGSIWDPFVGIISRSYHREYLTKELK